MASLRQRSTKESSGSPSTSKQSGRAKTEDDDSAPVTFSGVLRILVGLLILNSALSYFVTSEGFFWGYRPAWTRSSTVKAWLRGPTDLTDAQLAAYDGTDLSLPILLAVNGTIFDVSASPSFYGPGGSYHFFAGRDGTRAFVTGCFAEDLVPDLRGAERMFLPLDYDEDDARSETLTTAERREVKLAREREMRVAKKKVKEAVGHWEAFFGGNEKYLPVGKVIRDEGWQEQVEERGLCEQAQKGRGRRGGGAGGQAS
ncbi:MAG: hypothetical protein M4579_005108 [Chaenotheca gracillima]|nr:MAG: hypothetical protein M4579_005108 [Chaenotheca gracillima]